MKKKVTNPPEEIIENIEIPIPIQIIIPIEYIYKESTMFYPTLHGMRAIFFTEISYYKSDGSVTDLHRVDKTVILVLAGLGDIEAAMPPEDFMRISNTYIVNLHEVAGMNNDHPFCVILKMPLKANGQTDNSEVGQIELDGSPDKKKEFMRRLLALGPNVKRR